LGHSHPTCKKTKNKVGSTESSEKLSYILKQTWWCLSVCGDKQGRAGRPGQPLWGAGQGAISIKEILGENRGPAFNQTKIQLKKKSL
jgi:hypothetical protein